MDIFGLQELMNGWLETHYFAVLGISMLIGMVGAGGIVLAWFHDEDEFIF